MNIDTLIDSHLQLVCLCLSKSPQYIFVLKIKEMPERVTLDSRDSASPLGGLSGVFGTSGEPISSCQRQRGNVKREGLWFGAC